MPLVAILTGSKSDLPVLEPCLEMLADLGIEHEVHVMSAHRSPAKVQQFADATGDWRRFHRDVTRVFPTVPAGTRVMIIGGPFQKYEYQIHILPAFAETTWGAGVTLQDYESGSLPAQLALVSDSPYVAEYRDGELVRLHDGSGGE